MSYAALAADVRAYQAEVAAAEAAHHKRRRAALKADQADARRRLKRSFDLVLLKRIELEACVCVCARYLNMICLSPRRERVFTKESHPGLARPKAPSLFQVYSAYLLHYCAEIACFWNQCCTKYNEKSRLNAGMTREGEFKCTERIQVRSMLDSPQWQQCTRDST